MGRLTHTNTHTHTHNRTVIVATMAFFSHWMAQEAERMGPRRVLIPLIDESKNVATKKTHPPKWRPILANDVAPDDDERGWPRDYVLPPPPNRRSIHHRLSLFFPIDPSLFLTLSSLSPAVTRNQKRDSIREVDRSGTETVRQPSLTNGVNEIENETSSLFPLALFFQPVKTRQN